VVVVVGPGVPAVPAMDTVVVTVDDALLATAVVPATVVVGTWTTAAAACDVTVTTGAFAPSSSVNAVLMADVITGAVTSESNAAFATGSIPVGKVTMYFTLNEANRRSEAFRRLDKSKKISTSDAFAPTTPPMIPCKKVVNSGSAIKLAGLGTSTFSCPSTLGSPVVVVTVIKVNVLVVLAEFEIDEFVEVTVVVVEAVEVVLLVVFVDLAAVVVVVRSLLVVLL